MKRVLLVGARPRSLTTLRNGLLGSGYRVTVATTSAQVWQTVMRWQVDAVVLMMGAGTAGLDLWRLADDLRAAEGVALIVLTRAGRNQDRLRAFRAGARQCLTLPTSPAEVSACLQVIWPIGVPLDGQRQTDYTDAELHIDFANHQVRRGEKTYSLTAREWSLLERLARSLGRFISSQELCQWVWGQGAWPSKRGLLKVHVCMLRQKVEPDARHPRYIVNRRGLGYAFIPQSSARPIEA